MSLVNVQRATQQTKILDKFYNTTLVVNTHEYDLIYSYFLSVMGSTAVAQNFTAYLFQVSNDTGIDALTYLDNLKGQDSVQLTFTMTYYLNSVRSNSTLLGIGTIITPNYYAARNVVI